MITLLEIQQKMSELKDWSFEGGALVRYFEFDSFAESIKFVNKVAELSEKHNHHPDILIIYKTVRINIITHSENALTEKDFELAKDIDQITT